MCLMLQMAKTVTIRVLVVLLALSFCYHDGGSLCAMRYATNITHQFEAASAHVCVTERGYASSIRNRPRVIFFVSYY